MSKRLRWGVLVLFAFLPLLWIVPAYSQSSEAVLYFPETGHWVGGEFLEVYLAASNPLEIYGLPITDAYPEEPPSQKTIQYFEKARFVLDPTAPSPLRISLSPLGKYLYDPGIPVTRPFGLSGCRRFPASTGYEVCYSFLKFFESNGGLTQFGYPISNFEKHDDILVQYFQLARFEWHPESPPGQRVKIGNLGREYFDANEKDTHRLLPDLTNAISQEIYSLRVRAYPGKSVVPLEGTQEIFIVVQDQSSLPVSGAQASLIIRYPDQSPEIYRLTPTNADGITSAKFKYSTSRPSLIELQVEVSLDNIRKTTLTSFQTWP